MGEKVSTRRHDGVTGYKMPRPWRLALDSATFPGVRHLLAYLLFVGLPLAGLLGVLRLGQGIRPPQAVHGQYGVTQLQSGNSCQAFLLSGDSSLTLAQSGRQVTATLGRTGAVTLRGTVSGSELSLAGVVLAGATPPRAACPVGDTVRLVGLARRAPDHGRLDATLRFAGCADCPPAEFSAVRRLPRRGRGI
jgi:hypothetical protein